MSNFIYRGNLDYDESIYKTIQQVKPGSYISVDNNFNIIRKHKDIAEIKSLSTETIRKRLNKFKQEMKKYFLDKENLNI